jgi:hypothetical protein
MRATGVVLILLGLAVALFAAWSAYGTGATAAHFQSAAAARGVPFDIADWSRHWLVESGVFGGIGLIFLLGGLLMAFRERSGLFVIAVGGVMGCIIPWLLQFSGFSVYGYEQPGVGESAFLLCIALAAAGVFWFRRPRADG